MGFPQRNCLPLASGRPFGAEGDVADVLWVQPFPKGSSPGRPLSRMAPLAVARRPERSGRPGGGLLRGAWAIGVGQDRLKYPGARRLNPRQTDRPRRWGWPCSCVSIRP